MVRSGVSRYSSGSKKAGRNVRERERLHWREAGWLGRYMSQYEDGK